VTDKIDLAVHFRRVINKRYHYYAWITGLATAIFLLFFFLSGKGGFPSSMASTACALCIGLLIRNFTHSRKMLLHLDRSQYDHFNELEKYLEVKQDEWQKNLWIRLMFGIVTGLAMFYFMLFHSDSSWTITISSLFIVFIVAIAILGWINFNDQVLLHDIRRSHRDQPSSMPE